MKNIVTSLFILFLSSSLAAQTKPSPLSTKGSKWVTLNDPVVQIDFPSDWTLDQSGLMGTKFIIFSPMDSQVDEFKENVNLQVTDLGAPGAISLDQFAKSGAEQIKKYITDAKVVHIRKLPKDGSGNDCFEVEFTGKQGQLSLHWKQHYRIKGRYAYIITFTADTTSYEQYSQLADQILGTFQIQ